MVYKGGEMAQYGVVNKTSAEADWLVVLTPEKRPTVESK